MIGYDFGMHQTGVLLRLLLLACRAGAVRRRVRFVIGIDGSRSIHFSRKLTVLNIEEKPSLQSEKF